VIDTVIGITVRIQVYVLIGIGRLLDADYQPFDNQPLPYRCISNFLCFFICACLLCSFICVVCFFWFFLYFCSVFPSVLWYCWVGLLTCKTVSQITYTVLEGTLNTVQSLETPSINR